MSELNGSAAEIRTSNDSTQRNGEPRRTLDWIVDNAWSSGQITDRIVQHIWGSRYIDDAVLYRQDAGANGSYESTWYHLTDHQFSTVALIDNSANLVERVSYTPYGEAQHHWLQDIDGDGDVDAADETLATNALNQRVYQSGYNVDADFNRDGLIDRTDTNMVSSGNFAAALPAGWISALGTGNGIGFSGYVFNVEIDAGGLYTARLRHYDPVWGRWISRDPLDYVDTMNLYGYVSGAPLTENDPLGLYRFSRDPEEDRRIKDGIRELDDWREGMSEGAEWVEDVLDQIGVAGVTVALVGGAIVLTFVTPGIPDEAVIAAILARLGPAGRGLIWAVKRTPGGLTFYKVISHKKAIERLKKGKDVYTKSRSKAKQLQKKSSGGAVHEEPHGPGYYPHYHGKDREGGHCFYGSPQAHINRRSDDEFMYDENRLREWVNFDPYDEPAGATMT